MMISINRITTRVVAVGRKACVKVCAKRTVGRDVVGGSGIGGSKIYAPRNDKQRKYIELLEMERPCIVVGHGTAGSGKTKLAIEVGIQKLLQKEVEKLVITRPAVAVDDEEHGFLPGGLWDKYKVWIMPVVECLQKQFGQDRIEWMLENGVLEIAPLAYMRGRTFENAWILCDEAQNMTNSQMLMLLTRIGKGSKLVFAGDLVQHDRTREWEEGGLARFIRMAEHTDYAHPDIKVVEFDENDVERHYIIPHILKLYEVDGGDRPSTALSTWISRV